MNTSTIGLSAWAIAGWIVVGIFISMVLFLAWVLFEERVHKHRLRRMQRETMEARQRQENWENSQRPTSDRRRGTRARLLR